MLLWILYFFFNHPQEIFICPFRSGACGHITKLSQSIPILLLCWELLVRGWVWRVLWSSVQFISEFTFLSERFLLGKSFLLIHRSLIGNFTGRYILFMSRSVLIINRSIIIACETVRTLALSVEVIGLVGVSGRNGVECRLVGAHPGLNHVYALIRYAWDWIVLGLLFWLRLRLWARWPSWPSRNLRGRSDRRLNILGIFSLWFWPWWFSWTSWNFISDRDWSALKNNRSYSIYFIAKSHWSIGNIILWGISIFRTTLSVRLTTFLGLIAIY